VYIYTSQIVHLFSFVAMKSHISFESFQLEEDYGILQHTELKYKLRYV